MGFVYSVWVVCEGSEEEEKATALCSLSRSLFLSGTRTRDKFKIVLLSALPGTSVSPAHLPRGSSSVLTSRMHIVTSVFIVSQVSGADGSVLFPLPCVWLFSLRLPGRPPPWSTWRGSPVSFLAALLSAVWVNPLGLKRMWRCLQKLLQVAGGHVSACLTGDGDAVT